MSFLDDPLDPSAVEQLRRSLVMSPAGQTVPIERNRALALLGELQRLSDQQRAVAGDLRAVLDRMQGIDRHPAG